MIHERDLGHLGRALKTLRLASGLQQKTIAEVTGMSRSQVSRYEGGRDTPNLVTVTRFLQTVGADFEDLQHAIMAAKEGRPRIDSAKDDMALLKDVLDRILRPTVQSIVADCIGHGGTHAENRTVR